MGVKREGNAQDGVHNQMGREIEGEMAQDGVQNPTGGKQGGNGAGRGSQSNGRKARGKWSRTGFTMKRGESKGEMAQNKVHDHTGGSFSL